jgi:RNA polymerase sigma-70 factor (ECF subfamily)
MIDESEVDPQHSKQPTPAGGSFPQTRWSLVVAAGSDHPASPQALEQLCRQYWPPVYTYLRSRGCSVEDAEDLTQTLFSNLIERQGFEGLSAECGRFRTFLLRCAKNLLATDWHARNAQKRGGGSEHVSIDAEEGEASFVALANHGGATPEILYERQWSTGLLRRVMVRLAEVYEGEGKADTFRALQAMIAGGQERGRYGELAAELEMSEASLRMMVFRMRKRYRTLLHDEIAQTVLDPAEIDDEINHLMNLYQND